MASEKTDDFEPLAVPELSLAQVIELEERLSHNPEAQRILARMMARPGMRKFDPAELQAPAGKPIVLRVKNLDPTPMEFESNSLRVEKVLTGNGEAVINIRPQAAGRYDFFDDFHASTTKGVLVVK